MSKFHNYQSRPNATIGHDENKVTFYSTDGTTTEYEDYRVIDFYGHTCMQFKKSQKKCMISLRCYPEGTAHFNRGILLLSDLENVGRYRTKIILTDDHQLTTLDNVHELVTPRVSKSHIEGCMRLIKDDIGANDYELLMDHIKDLDALLDQPIDIANHPSLLP